VNELPEGVSVRYNNACPVSIPLAGFEVSLIDRFSAVPRGSLAGLRMENGHGPRKNQRAHADMDRSRTLQQLATAVGFDTEKTRLQKDQFAKESQTKAFDRLALKYQGGRIQLSKFIQIF
jgi:hypothetical protein